MRALVPRPARGAGGPARPRRAGPRRGRCRHPRPGAAPWAGGACDPPPTRRPPRRRARTPLHRVEGAEAAAARSADDHDLLAQHHRADRCRQPERATTARSASTDGGWQRRRRARAQAFGHRSRVRRPCRAAPSRRMVAGAPAPTWRPRSSSVRGPRGICYRDQGPLPGHGRRRTMSTSEHGGTTAHGKEHANGKTVLRELSPLHPRAAPGDPGRLPGLRRTAPGRVRRGRSTRAPRS